MRRTAYLFALTLVGAATAAGYPLDGQQRTGIRRLEGYRNAQTADHGSRLPPGALLGTDDKRTYFAVSVTDDQRDAIIEKRPWAEFADLRRYSIDMDAKHAGILAYAKALHYWQHRHRFCGVCGSPNRLRSAGHRLVCSNSECARQSFPRIDPAIIVLVTQGDACLLGRNARWPAKRFSTLAGAGRKYDPRRRVVIRPIAGPRQQFAVRVPVGDIENRDGGKGTLFL